MNSRFVIVGTQRTGTTLVRTSLNSHSRIRCSGEVFKTRPPPYKEPDGYWAYCRSDRMAWLKKAMTRRAHIYGFLNGLLTDGRVNAVGFKLMFSHARRYPEVVQYIRETALKVIHVERRNSLKTLLSREIAKATGVYHRIGDGPGRSATPVRLDPRTIVARLDAIGLEGDTWRTLLTGGLEVHSITYEDFVAGQDAQSRALLAFLGVDYEPLRSELSKVNPTDPKLMIENYDEIAEVLKDTRHVCFLVRADA